MVNVGFLLSVHMHYSSSDPSHNPHAVHLPWFVVVDTLLIPILQFLQLLRLAVVVDVTLFASTIKQIKHLQNHPQPESSLESSGLQTSATKHCLQMLWIFHLPVTWCGWRVAEHWQGSWMVVETRRDWLWPGITSSVTAATTGSRINCICQCGRTLGCHHVTSLPLSHITYCQTRQRDQQQNQESPPLNTRV